MKIKDIVDEDFVNYREAAMFIGTVSCAGKCCIEAGIPLSVCQNDGWRKKPPIDMRDSRIVERYVNNPITHAIVFGGLEPLEQMDDIVDFMTMLRIVYHCNDTVVIYTGYNRDEPEAIAAIERLMIFENIIMKFGRYIPNRDTVYDDVLGVTLSSDNQYAERIC